MRPGSFEDMHPIDRAASWVFRLGPSTRAVFRDGWGDETLLAALDAADRRTHAPEISIDWGPERHENGLIIKDGSFPSPADHLPAASRLAEVRMIAPEVADGRLVVMMAAWNDHGFSTRSVLAAQLARYGVTTVMLENPYYGSRRVGQDPPIRTVADFAVMGRAAVVEGWALTAHFAEDNQVGVAGYSMGGNIAALVGALANHPTAIAALAASHSPAPVCLDGVIRNVIDWDALGGPGAAARLRREFSKATVLAIEPRPHTAAAIVVGGTRDGYIPRYAVEDLHAHWPGSQLRWLEAGHATMLWRHKPALMDAILASFERLAAV